MSTLSTTYEDGTLSILCSRKLRLVRLSRDSWIFGDKASVRVLYQPFNQSSVDWMADGWLDAGFVPLAAGYHNIHLDG